MTRVFLKYELIKLFRHSWQLLTFALVILVGILAVGYGNKEITKQNTIIDKIQRDQQKNIEELQLGFNADTTSNEGNIAFNRASNPARMSWSLQLYTVNAPQVLSVFSLGLRDLFPFYLKLKPYSLYMQLFQDEISNPLKLLVGNFDLSFVIIYLFPILIIAIGYNLLSEEKEQGTMGLCITHGFSVKKMIQWKILFYFGLFSLITFLVVLIGFWFSVIEISNHTAEFFIWLGASWVYVSFWFALVFFVISFNMSSAVNVVILAVAWLLILMIYPSSVNLLSTIVKPVKNQHLSNVIRRYTIEEDDKTIKKYLSFYESKHPEYQPIDTTTHKNNLSKAYISFHEHLDEKHGKIVDAYYEDIEARVNWSEGMNFLNPAVNISYVFNHLGSTGFNTYKAFLAQTKTFHAEMKQFFHPQLFKNELMKPSNYEHIPSFEFKAPTWSISSLLYKFFFTLFLVSVLIGWAYLNLLKTAKS